MAQKDLCEKLLEDYNDVFSDIFNVLLFKKNLIKEQDLLNGPTESVYKSEQGYLREQRRDVFKCYFHHYPMAIYSLAFENYSSIDKYAPVRIMGYDYASYRSQMDHKQYPLRPVITVILNFSSRRWQKKNSLHDIMAAPKEFFPYVADYKLHVFDIAFLEDDIINQFTSDFKLVAQFFKNKRLGNTDFFTNDKIIHVEAFLDFLSVFTKDSHYRKIKNDLLEINNKGRDVTMCMIAETLEKRGIQKGHQLGLSEGQKLGQQQERLSLLKALLLQGFSFDQILSLGYSEDEILPWDTIDVGVSKKFLKLERKRAYAETVTPDCRKACAGCGANCLLKEVECDA